MLLWAEPPVWDPLTHTDIAVTPTPSTVDFGQTVATISVYDPPSGTAALAVFHDVRSVLVGITDHPLIIEASGPAITPALGNFAYKNAVTGQSGSVSGALYSGPVSYLQQQFIWNSADGVSLAANIPSVFLHGNAGDDALAVSGGNNVLDDGGGSNFLVGAVGRDGGTDTFFLDGRSGTSTWSTVVHFHLGDTVTLFGFTAGVSTEAWDDSDGTAGYEGLTLHSELSGRGTGINASMTLAGLSLADL